MLCAKLAMVELAGGMGYRQPNAAFTGPGVNPWSRDAWSGGSSSGSGSAVAAGLVPFAIGSETWGSILSPAGDCGVAGLRPTYGRVSRHGAMALCWTLDKLGPLALTADDCGLVLEAIAGRDPADPTTTAAPFRHEPAGPAGRRFRFGVLRGRDRRLRGGGARELRALARRAAGDRHGRGGRRCRTCPTTTSPGRSCSSEAASAFEDLIESGAIAGLDRARGPLHRLRARRHPGQGLPEGAAAARA